MNQSSRYELLILTTPEITQDETKDLEKKILKLVKESSGTISSFERWGKYRLSYPVNKHEYGVYFLTRFDVQNNTKLNNDINSLLKVAFDGIVMRNILSVLSEDNPIEYLRPRSLEDVPKKDTASLLKSKKVEDLISAVDSTRDSRKTTKEAPAKVKSSSEESTKPVIKTAKSGE